MTKTTLVIALVPALILGGCNSFHTQPSPLVDPDVPVTPAPPLPVIDTPASLVPATVTADPNIPVSSTGALIKKVVDNTKKACSFEPEFETVLALVGKFYTKVDKVGPVVKAICDGVKVLQTTSASTRHRKPVMVRGVALRGHFIR
jgi:hypothetical protein